MNIPPSDSLKILVEGGVDIDYLALLHGDLSVLDTIEDLGQAEVVGQALTNVQDLDTVHLSASHVYHHFARREFFALGAQLSSHVEAFSRCTNLLQQLSPPHLQQMMRTVIVAEQGLRLIPRPDRFRILKKSLKLIEVKIAGKASGDWSGLLEWGTGLKQHLERFTSRTGADILDSLEDAQEKEAVQQLEMTGGEEASVVAFLVSAIAGGLSQEILRYSIKSFKK